MARKPSPWYREDRNGWYVTLDGQRHFLGEHPAGAPRPRKSEKTGRWNAPTSIEEEFVRLQSGQHVESDDEGGVAALAGEDDVVAVLDDFITWCKENREPVTANRYEEFCQGFVRAAGSDGVRFGDLPIGRLTSKHVTAWLAQKETWGPTTKKNAITALQAGFNWAVQNRGLDKNPIKGMKKPEAKRRSGVVAPGEFEEMLGLIDDQQFRDLLSVSYDSGGRPFEIKELEKRHLQFDKQRAVIPADEAKGRKHTRTVYFPTDRSMEIVRRLAEEHPTGPIFRNRRGNPWTGDAVKCRFEDIEVEFGLKEMQRQGIDLDTSEESIAAMMTTLSPTRKQKGTGKEVPKQKWELRKEARLKLVAGQARKYGKRFNHYAFRRTFITEKIIAGVDSHVVARLAGHQSTAMIDRHYSAVANDHEFMLREAQRQIETKGEKKE
jgi:integrase